MVLLSVVWMQSVGHISRQKEALVNGLEVLVLVECREVAEDTLRNLNSHVAVCALRRLRAALLVIEKHDHVDLRVVTLLKRDL